MGGVAKNFLCIEVKSPFYVFVWITAFWQYQKYLSSQNSELLLETKQWKKTYRKFQIR